MIDFVRPGLLAAGLAAALVPLLLHFFSRHPTTRTALPTFRFLSPDARTAPRLRRRPTDLLLLALRMLLLALLGAGLAGPRWVPERGGVAEIVLLDRSASLADAAAWRAAVDSARARLVGSEGQARGALVLFDTSAVVLPPAALTAARLDSLAASPPTDAPPPEYAAALRALRGAAAGLRGADSLRAALVTAPAWAGWSPGLAEVRRAAWPGALDVVSVDARVSVDGARPVNAVGSVDRGGSAGADASPTAVVLSGGDEGAYVVAALEAMGWRARRIAPGDVGRVESADAYVVLAEPTEDAARLLVDRARRGATVVVGGDASATALNPVLPWRGISTAGDRAIAGETSADGDRSTDRGRSTDGYRATAGEETADGDGATGGGEVVFASGLQLDGAAGRARGEPAEGARVLAAWDDGRVAAVASPVDGGCAVFFAAALEGGGMPLNASYPRAMDRLARGCEAVAGERGDGGRLDAGALAVLRGTGQATVAAADVGTEGGGVPLGRWILGAALLVALVETALAYGGGRRG